MNDTLKEMLGELAATRERERILAIAGHGADIGKFEAACKLASIPSMTPAVAAQLLAGGTEATS
jgi:hypothetical protein